MSEQSTEPEPQRRLEDLVSEYGTARHNLVDAIHLHKDYKPFNEQALNLYSQITDRLAELRKLAHEQLARPGHPNTRRVSAAEVLHILDGAE